MRFALNFFSGRYRALFGLLACFGIVESSRSAIADDSSSQIQQRAIALVSGSKCWAGRVATSLSVYDARNQLMGRIDSREELEVVGGQPLWRKKHEIKSGSPGMIVSMDFGVQKSPDTMLDGYDTWVLLGREQIGDDLVQVWLGVSREDDRNTAKAYLQESSGWPLKIKFTIPFKVMLTTQVVSFTLEYKKFGEFGWLPWRGEIDQTARVFFSKRRVHIHFEYTDWQRVLPAG